VFTRHTPTCDHKDDRLWRQCNCRKHLYIYEDGRVRFMSARTRAWKKAEALATTELAARDPVLRRLREIEDQEAAKRAADAAKLAARATIHQALLDWDNETHQAHTPGSASVLRTFIRKVGDGP
jgi:hypothetical protein